MCKASTILISMKSSMYVRLYRAVIDVYVVLGRVAEAMNRRPGALQERAEVLVASS